MTEELIDTQPVKTMDYKWHTVTFKRGKERRTNMAKITTNIANPGKYPSSMGTPTGDSFLTSEHKGNTKGNALECIPDLRLDQPTTHLDNLSSPSTTPRSPTIGPTNTRPITGKDQGKTKSNYRINNKHMVPTHKPTSFTSQYKGDNLDLNEKGNRGMHGQKQKSPTNPQKEKSTETGNLHKP